MDREKVITQLENDAIATDTGYVEVPLWLFSEILVILKEQEAQKFLVDEYGKITPLPVVVRCKDCEHCYFASNRVQDERSYACGKHGIDVTPDWFCADAWKRDSYDGTWQAT